MNEISMVTYKEWVYEAEPLKDIGAKLGHFIDGCVESLPAQPINVAFVSSNPRKLRPLLDAVHGSGHSVEQINPGVFSKKYDSLTTNLWAVVVICIDDFGGTGLVFQKLQRFRIECPNIPVILVSSDFSKDDLSCERLPLGDISLRCPLGGGRFNEKIEQAHTNNVIWQVRVQEIYPPLDVSHSDEGDIVGLDSEEE